MKALILSAVLTCLASVTAAQTALETWEADRTHIFNATEIDPADFVWIGRPIVVFAQSPLDPQFVQQMELLAARPDALAERDVVVNPDGAPEESEDLRSPP